VAIGAGLLLASLYLWTERAMQSTIVHDSQKIVADTTPASATPQATAVAPDTVALVGRGAPPKPDSAAAPVVKPPPPLYDTRPIDQLASAIKTGDIDKVQIAYPGLTEQQKRYFRDELFAGKEIRQVRPILHSATITGDSAKMPLEFRITLSPKGAPGSPTMAVIPYSATFVLSNNGKFQLVALQPRQP
jgi:hypothetical protein